jgi:hypothetical protein
VVLAYLYHFHQASLLTVLARRRRWVWLLTAALLAPCLALTLEKGWFMSTIGLTCTYLGCGGLVLLAATARLPERAASSPWYRLTQRVGMDSYSIYLWHMAVDLYIWPGLKQRFGLVEQPLLSSFGFYEIAGSILVGMLMGRLVETPFLRLRDHWLPARRPLLPLPAGLDPAPAPPAAPDEAAGWLDRSLDRASELIGWLARRFDWLCLGAYGLIVLGLAGRALFQPTNLALHASWRVSSTYGAFPSSGQIERFPERSPFFHTEEEASPWLQIDLGAPQRVSRLRVTNRVDCCQERALPLVAESSLDGKSWAPLAERKTTFAAWNPAFSPREIRYLRLRTSRRSMLHLSGVEVF